MARIRRCDSRCHHAKGTRCACWCGGTFHGSTGAAKREALADQRKEEAEKTLECQGFKKGKTALIVQKEFPPTLSWDD